MTTPRRSAIVFLSFALAAAVAGLAQSEEFADYSESVGGRSIPMVAVRGGSYRAVAYLPVEQSEFAANRWEVTVSSFWIGKYELRLGEYRDWLQERDRPAKAADDQRARRTLEHNKPEAGLSYGGNPREANSDEHPIVGVHQWSAKRYCHWLSMKTGRFYRLPTEAEWEYACRAGGEGRYPWGDSPDELKKYAVTAPPDRFDQFLQVVGTKAPNAWGIYDMIGNAEEWVADGYLSIRVLGRTNPITWPASRQLSQDAEKIWDAFKAEGEWFAKDWGVAKGGSHDYRRNQRPWAFTVAARTNPSLLSNHEDPNAPFLSQDTCGDLMHNVGEAIGFRIARPLTVPDRTRQLWHWGIYFDHDQWRDLTLAPSPAPRFDQ